MRALLAIAAFAAAAIAGDVVQLTPDNFEAEVGDKNLDVVLVKFYAPWCGHCKAMAADYETAATQIKATHPKIKIAEFDADAHREYASKYEIQGFPTLKVFRHGDLKAPEDYSGPRNADGIAKAVVKLGKPAVTEFATVAEMTAAAAIAIADGEIVIAGAFPQPGKDVEAFKKFARKAKSFTVLLVPTGADARSVTVQSPGEEAVAYEEAKFSSAKLLAWADKNKFPAYGEISQDNFKAYVDRGVPLGWTFIDPSDTESAAKVAEIMTELGKKYKGQISLVHLSGVQYGSMAERVGLDGKAFPSFGIDDQAAKKHFGFKPEGQVPDKDALDTFIKSVLAGDIAPTVRSQPEPESQPDADGVFVLTGNNFMANTIDSGKDVFVEFYAPWCGHCKALAPQYAEVATAAAKHEKLTIAKFDATTNDIPSSAFDVSGYPTLYFIKASADGSAGKPIVYSGGRTKDDIQKFIEEHATHPVAF